MNPTHSNETEPKGFPHLTQERDIEGVRWTIVHLDMWTPSPNRYIPIVHTKLFPLDEKISVRLAMEYDRFRRDPDCHIQSHHASIPMRSPYSDTQEMYSIVVARALLAMWFQFSYHNWLEQTPKGTIFGRFCDDKICRNPRHHAMGMKQQSRATQLLYGTSVPTVTSEQPIPSEDQDWIALEDVMLNVIAEGRSLGDSNEKIILETTAIIANRWGLDRPPPARSGWTSVEECVTFKVSPPRGITPHMRDAALTPMQILSAREEKK